MTVLSRERSVDHKFAVTKWLERTREGVAGGRILPEHENRSNKKRRSLNRRKSRNFKKRPGATERKVRPERFAEPGTRIPERPSGAFNDRWSCGGKSVAGGWGAGRGGGEWQGGIHGLPWGEQHWKAGSMPIRGGEYRKLPPVAMIVLKSPVTISSQSRAAFKAGWWPAGALHGRAAAPAGRRHRDGPGGPGSPPGC